MPGPADDLDLLYAGDELADRVTWRGGAFGGFLDLSDVAVLEGRSQAAEPQLTYPASIALAVNDELIIRGRRFRVVSDPERVGDGLECIVTLRAL